MRLRAIPVIASLFFLLAASAGAQREAAPDERYVGHYVFAASMNDGRRRVMTALRPALERLPALVRNTVESRLSDGEPVPRTIDVWLRGQRAFVRYAGDDEPRTFETRLGQPTEVETRMGRTATLTQLFRDGHFEQIFQSDRGRWYNVFTLDESGDRLQLRVAVTSERLDTPLHMELPYVRQ